MTSKYKKALEAVEVTLDKMYHGGIYDWVEGGFARYSVDGKWFAPHFEKMLYDNAQLISLYADAFKVTQKDEYLTCVEDTITFITTHLKHNNLGYFSALDADSEGEEGLYYTWTFNEIENLLGVKEFEIAKAFFDLKPTGNWEDQRNILASTQSLEQLAATFEMTLIQVKSHLKSIKSKLKSAREKREMPGLDNKLITAHNAMMVKGLVKSYQASGKVKYKGMALDLMQSLTDNAIDDNFRINRLVDKNSPRGFLDDYVFMIEALMYCYEISFDNHYLIISENLLQFCLEHFTDDHKDLFYYASKDSKLIAKKIEFSDNVIPSSNAVMACNLWKLGHFLSKPNYIERAKQMVESVKPLYKKYSLYFSTWHQLHLAILKGQIEVAVTGAKSLEYCQELQKHYLSYTQYCGGMKEDLPQLKQKVKSNLTQVFICQNHTCSKPFTNVKESVEMLKGKIK
jgi:uncharacterized protein YyaL (SSP411 family)